MHVLRTIFDWIFPPSEELARVQTLDVEHVTRLYHPRFVYGVHVLASFSSPSIRALIHEAKFHHNTRAYVLLAALTDLFLAESKESYDLLIPVPLSKKRMRERGHNQVLSVLTHTSRASCVTTKVLLRTRHTVAQTSLTREKRLQNVRDAFGVAHGDAVRGKHILLIDDVTTTGATLQAAKDALLPHSPSKVTCLALAH